MKIGFATYEGFSSTLFLVHFLVYFLVHLHLNIQGGPYVFERFLEAALRPWMVSDKNFVDKKKLLRYIPFKDYKTDFW